MTDELSSDFKRRLKNTAKELKSEGFLPNSRGTPPADKLEEMLVEPPVLTQEEIDEQLPPKTVEDDDTINLDEPEELDSEVIVVDPAPKVPVEKKQDDELGEEDKEDEDKEDDDEEEPIKPQKRPKQRLKEINSRERQNDKLEMELLRKDLAVTQQVIKDQNTERQIRDVDAQFRQRLKELDDAADQVKKARITGYKNFTPEQLNQYIEVESGLQVERAEYLKEYNKFSEEVKAYRTSQTEAAKVEKATETAEAAKKVEAAPKFDKADEALADAQFDAWVENNPQFEYEVTDDGEQKFLNKKSELAYIVMQKMVANGGDPRSDAFYKELDKNLASYVPNWKKTMDKPKEPVVEQPKPKPVIAGSIDGNTPQGSKPTQIKISDIKDRKIQEAVKIVHRNAPEGKKNAEVVSYLKEIGYIN